MTAILGYANGERVWIGGDSAAQNGGWARFTIRERKVWRVGEFVIGGSGRQRIAQLLQAVFAPPEHSPAENAMTYLVAAFVPSLREVLKAHDETMANDVSGTGLVIGYRGVVYHLDSAFNINAIEPQIINEGAGGDMAMGAFVALLDSGVAVEEAMMKALEITGRHDLTVAPPFYIVSI